MLQATNIHAIKDNHSNNFLTCPDYIADTFETYWSLRSGDTPHTEQTALMISFLFLVALQCYRRFCVSPK